MGLFSGMKENREKADRLKADCKIVLDFLVKISNSALANNPIAHDKFEEVYAPFFLQHGIEGYNMLEREIKKRNDKNALEFWLKYQLTVSLLNDNI